MIPDGEDIDGTVSDVGQHYRSEGVRASNLPLLAAAAPRGLPLYLLLH